MDVKQLSLADYSKLDNVPVMNQDLSASGFTPVANTYYKHTGATTDTFVQGVIYYYDGSKYNALNGSGGVDIAATQEEFNSFIVAENVGKLISYNGDLYIVDVAQDAFVDAPVAVGDKISELQFDTTKTPDLYPLLDADIIKLIITGTYSVDVGNGTMLDVPFGLQLQQQWEPSNTELCWIELVDSETLDTKTTIFYRQAARNWNGVITDELGWLVDSLILDTPVTVTEVNGQDTWSDYTKVKYASKVYAKKIATIEDINTRLDTIEAQIGSAVAELATI